MSALSAALLIFSFQFSLLYFHISVEHQHCVVLVLICSIGHRALPKILVGTFLVRNVRFSGKTELILTIKMEIRHPVVVGSFCSEFLAICNHCVFMAA